MNVKHILLFISILFLTTSLKVKDNFFTVSITYYVSNAGSDAAAGTSSGTSWKTLAKVNSFSFAPGDVVLFNRGDTWVESLSPPTSGNSGGAITFGSYGSGAKPVITGFSTISAWTNLGSNIWQSTSAVTSLSTLNMVVINGVNTPMGRIPNSGWYTISSHSGGTQITSASLGAPNWTGAEVVSRKEHYILDRGLISSQAGSTINHANNSGYSNRDGAGFFIQNDARTLDAQNEWYFDPATKKLKVYSVGSPTGVQVPAISDVVSMSSDYITFDNIKFTGANDDMFRLSGSTHVTIQNCDLDFSGVDGVKLGSGSTFFRLTTSTVNHSNNDAINDVYETGNTNATIDHSTIKNTAMIAGVSGSADGSAFNIGINSNNGLIEYNWIDSSGYLGIYFADNTTVQNNFLTNFCMVKDDGAGIYTGNAGSGKIIRYNIVLYGIGNGSGTQDGVNEAKGIYVDDFGQNIQIYNNTVAFIANTGYYLHNVNNINFYNNTSYDNDVNQLVVWTHLGTTTNLNIHNNIFFSKYKKAGNSQPFTAFFNTSGSAYSSWGTFANNIYARPISTNFMIHTLNGGSDNESTVAQWQAMSGQDAGSTNAPWSIVDTSELRFEVNPTNASVVVALGANYVDVYNTNYPGTITLAAYSSAILKYVSAISGVPVDPPNPTSNSPQATTVTLTRSGSPPAGVTWYWQFSCGTNTAIGSGTTYNATSTGTYYIRARDNSSGVWSTGCGSLAVTVTGGSVPSNPGNPTSNSPQAGSVTITRTGSPGGGETWYWQNTSCGTSTAFGSGATFNATSSGTYYIRANNAYGWSAACGSVAVVVVAPGTTNTLFKWKGKLIISY